MAREPDALALSDEAQRYSTSHYSSRCLSAITCIVHVYACGVYDTGRISGLRS